MINRLKYSLTFIILLVGLTFSYSQTDNEQLKINAAMFVHCDWGSDFPATSNSVLSDYTISVLKHEGISECTFLEIRPNTEIKATAECSFVLAYSNQEKRFFKLRGFKYNEFNEFYNLVLINGAVPNVDGKRKRKVFKQIVEQVQIDRYDFEKSYKKYYGKYKACLIDESSCYRKLLIREY